MLHKVWFVTGASRGLGLDIARAALVAGNKVVATARKVEGVAQKIGGTKETLLVLPMDVTDFTSVESAVESAKLVFGTIDVLVNNAGYGQLGSFETISPTAIQRQFDVNVFGLMEVTRHVLPIMRSQMSGHIFNISSIGGARGYPVSSIYCATKFAVEGFSESMAREVEAFGIKTTIVEPGFFRTDFLDMSSVVYGDLETLAYNEVDEEMKNTFDGYSHSQPGDPEKLGQVLVHLSGLDDAPLRFTAGTDALEIVGVAFDERQAELEKWQDLSRTTDFIP
jgi:NAD(P)-dependent dehydrogenase (short-subunit alcohol dehydrogenase family)